MGTSNSFRENIQAHRDAGTCYICGKPVAEGESHHGATGAHWGCHKAEEEETAKIIARGDAAIASLGLKRKRRSEGEGATATKAKALAVVAIEEALSTKIYDITLWNQQGVYRGPRWDLDVWGLNFSFEQNGHKIGGSASALATMTQCVKCRKLVATPDGFGAFSFFLGTEAK